MKKIVISACALALSCGLLFGCASEEAATETTETPAAEETEATETETTETEATETEKAASDEVVVNETGVTMQYVSPEDAQSGDYVLVDLRKAADYEAGHLDGALSADMDAAVSQGDWATAIANMQAIEKDIDGKKVALICYSGKKYAQAGTDILNAMGFDMANVYTLEGGMKAVNGEA